MEIRVVQPSTDDLTKSSLIDLNPPPVRSKEWLRLIIDQDLYQPLWIRNSEPGATSSSPVKITRENLKLLSRVIISTSNVHSTGEEKGEKEEKEKSEKYSGLMNNPESGHALRYYVESDELRAKLDPCLYLEKGWKGIRPIPPGEEGWLCPNVFSQAAVTVASRTKTRLQLWIVLLMIMSMILMVPDIDEKDPGGIKL
ncbi:hypothetical protein NC651_004670 [Populus alba x Populus x berolinensis]|nr:hypothetical protein NC651_004670 [Populus alba x Populus x berolinensis]